MPIGEKVQKRIIDSIFVIVIEYFVCYGVWNGNPFTQYPDPYPQLPVPLPPSTGFELGITPDWSATAIDVVVWSIIALSVFWLVRRSVLRLIKRN